MIFKQSIMEAEKVVDTTGAGDTFISAYPVAFVGGKLEICSCNSSLYVQVKGAILSMPCREAGLDLLQSNLG
ncbi:putative carbohydrate/purine kinase, PfkB, carbohydrate kinase PfkB, ribokinase [Helianthus annuus]|nr:putative carbohydrate/purine kinase, PfkB, carbohydrate kinase PfkB, ribokinase [Helianthus annuus]